MNIILSFLQFYFCILATTYSELGRYTEFVVSKSVIKTLNASLLIATSSPLICASKLQNLNWQTMFCIDGGLCSVFRMGICNVIYSDSETDTSECYFKALDVDNVVQFNHNQFNLPKVGCIEIVEEALSWEEAKSHCASEEEELLTIKGRNFKFLVHFVKQIGKKFWLNIHRDDFGYIRWSSGEYIMKDFALWESGEPKTTNGGDCAYINEVGKLVITTCNDTITFICKFY